MSVTKCISGNDYKTGSCVQGAMPTGVFTSDLTANNFAPNVRDRDSQSLISKFVSVSASSSGNNTLVAAVTGKKIRVLSYSLVAAGAVTVKFQSGSTGTDLTGAMSIAANGTVSADSVNGLFETAASTLLNLSLGGAVSVTGHITYIEV